LDEAIESNRQFVTTSSQQVQDLAQEFTTFNSIRDRFAAFTTSTNQQLAKIFSELRDTMDFVT